MICLIKYLKYKLVNNIVLVINLCLVNKTSPVDRKQHLELTLLNMKYDVIDSTGACRHNKHDL